MAFDATWSVGNIITVAATLGGGILAFNRIINKLTATQVTQDTAIALMAAHQESAIGLLSQSVEALRSTAIAMQPVLVEQQNQLTVTVMESEYTRRLREIKEN